jgi:hypothetical protein
MIGDKGYGRDLTLRPFLGIIVRLKGVRIPVVREFERLRHIHADHLPTKLPS